MTTGMDVAPEAEGRNAGLRDEKAPGRSLFEIGATPPPAGMLTPPPAGMLSPTPAELLTPTPAELQTPPPMLAKNASADPDAKLLAHVTPAVKRQLDTLTRGESDASDEAVVGDPAAGRPLGGAVPMQCDDLGASSAPGDFVGEEMGEEMGEEADEDEDDGDDDGMLDRSQQLKFEWRVENFESLREEAVRMQRDLNERMQRRSPESVSPDGRRWGLLLFPNGLPTSDGWSSAVSAYVEMRDPEEETKRYGSSAWSLRRYYSIAIVNHRKPKPAGAAPAGSAKTAAARAPGADGEPQARKKMRLDGGTLSAPEPPRKDIVLHATDSFTVNHVDWGFAQALPLDQATKEAGFLDEEGALVLRATVTPRMDWHLYSSKAATGYVGLENHGATCYLNSLLQTLFMTTSLRQAVYELDTTDDVRNSGIGLELQRLFWRLQSSPEAISTRQLTTAFGWESHLLSRQHDVQEMNRELVDKLESRMKATPLEGTIKRLYTGKTRSYISCDNVDFTSTRDEEFYDIQLDVKGVRDVYDAFRKYTQEEKLEGENQYEAEGHGKQDATKGIGFLSFPPVLNLHLKRFEFDMLTEGTVKINDPFKFPVRLTLDKFLHKDAERADKTPQYQYVLHSVLVHVGDINSGHYYAFINDLQRKDEVPPDADPDDVLARYSSRWLRFDDERVTLASKRQAVHANYGGGLSSGGAGGSLHHHRLLDSGHGNAYMLVYLQLDCLDEVLPPAPPVPPALLERFRADEEQQRREREEEQRRRDARIVFVATKETLREFYTFGRHPIKHKRHLDFCDWRQTQRLEMHKDDTLETLYDNVARLLGVSRFTVRLWIAVDRQNFTTRPDSALQCCSLTSLDRMTSCVDGYCVYAEQISAEELADVGFVDNNSIAEADVLLLKQQLDIAEADAKMETEDEDKSRDDEDNALPMLNGSRADYQRLEAAKDMHGQLCRRGMEEAGTALLFFRQFDPGANTLEGKLKHLDCLLVSGSVTVSNFMSECLLPFLSARLGKPVTNATIWEAMTPRRVKVIDCEACDTPDAAFLPTFRLQHGDTLLFEVLPPKEEAVVEVKGEAEQESKAGEEGSAAAAVAASTAGEGERGGNGDGDGGAGAATSNGDQHADESQVVEVRELKDGSKQYNYAPARRFKRLAPLLRHLDLRLTVAVFCAEQPSVSERFALELHFVDKISVVRQVVARALLEQKHAGALAAVAAAGSAASADSIVADHLRLYRARGLFKEPDAQALENLDHSLEVTVWKALGPGEGMPMPSIWAAREGVPAMRAFFFSVLPCPIEELDRLFEVALQGERWPRHKTELIYLKTDEADMEDLGVQHLSEALLARVGAEKGAIVRWISMSNQVELVVGQNEREDPRAILPNYHVVRDAPRGRHCLVADVIRADEDAAEQRSLDLVTGPHQHRTTALATDVFLVVVMHFDAADPDKCEGAATYGQPLTLVLSEEDTPATVLAKVAKRLRLDAPVDWPLAVLHGRRSFKLLEAGEPVLAAAKALHASSLRDHYAVLGLLHAPPGDDGSQQAPLQRHHQPAPQRLPSDGGRSPLISDSAISRPQPHAS